jgi:hypothetical protein
MNFDTADFTLKPNQLYMSPKWYDSPQVSSQLEMDHVGKEQVTSSKAKVPPTNVHELQVPTTDADGELFDSHAPPYYDRSADHRLGSIQMRLTRVEELVNKTVELQEGDAVTAAQRIDDIDTTVAKLSVTAKNARVEAVSPLNSRHARKLKSRSQGNTSVRLSDVEVHMDEELKEIHSNVHDISERQNKLKKHVDSKCAFVTTLPL